MIINIGIHQWRSNTPIYWHCNIASGLVFVHVTADSPQAAYEKAKALLAEMTGDRPAEA